MRIPFLVPVFLMALEAAAQGAQVAAFSSRSTQGFQWTGGAEIVSERFDITVHRDYLDVEHDLEIAARGAWGPSSHADKLEIVGTLTLERGSTVVGILVWYKDMILKGKLKPKVEARKQYEDVVDRNTTVPPPPRDPVLLEQTRTEGAYDISIFPVEWGKSRRIRLRYLVPSREQGILAYPHAFSDVATARVKPGPGLAGFRIQSTQGLSDAVDEAVTLQSPVYSLRPWGWGAGITPQALVPEVPDTSGSRMVVGSFTGHRFEGHMAHWFLQVPASLRTFHDFDAASDRIQATLGTAPDTCTLTLPDVDGGPSVGTNLRVYYRNLPGAWIRWKLVRDGKVLRDLKEEAVLERAEDGLHYARSFGGVKFYPMATTMPPSLGLALGFIDPRYSLVALEQDALAPADAAAYAARGVPTLRSEDVFPAKDEAYDQSLMAWLVERGWSREQLLRPTRLAPVGGLPAGMRLSVRDGRLRLEIDPSLRRDGKLRLAVHDLSGRKVHAWQPSELAAGGLTWAPAAGRNASATYVVKVEMGGKTWSQAFRIP